MDEGEARRLQRLTVPFSTELGGRVLRQLESERVVWLTTVDSRGTPQPRPIWFLWDDTSVLIYSRPDAYKVRHIRRNPRVSLNFNTDREADRYAVLTGDALIDPDAPRSDHNVLYQEKYREEMDRLGMTPEGLGAAYSTAIRVTPMRLRGQ